MYLALYRKYRPRTFDDVISQPHIVTTLKNQIATGQNAHAYLFTGSRGTGKTTCAKILAMALNCQHPVNGNPCLECQSCREIASEEATDILEIDAASNRSVNDVQELQNQLAYTPVSCKYRVYIMDEVHMLSPQAFNALLKTIEEPPPHVIFIFATTELHKVPATILSRCQRFEFRRIDIADSSARLMGVAQNEGITLTQEAADMISRLSDGGMRDALSLLDRCIAMSHDVTEDTVRSCAGVADNHHLFHFADMIAAQDIAGCITLLEQLYKGGKDVARIMEELGGVFRDLMLCSSAPAEKGLLSVMPSDYEEIARLSGQFSLGEILRCLTLIQECSDKISNSRSRRTMAEMCFVKLCIGAPTAEQSAAAARPVAQPRPAPKPAEYKPMGSEFAPLPDDKLNPRAAHNLSEIQKIFSEPEPKKQESPAPAPAPAKPQDAPAAEITTPQTAANAANINKVQALASQFIQPEPKMPEAPAKPQVSPAATAQNAENAANIRKVQKIADQFAQAAPEKLQAAPAPAMQLDAPPPELNSRPAAPEEMDFAPPPEEPPMEFIPQREFEIPSAAPTTPAKPEKPSENPQEAPHEPKKQENPAVFSKPNKPAEPAPDKPAETSGYVKLTAVTPEQWNEVLNKISPLYSAMLDGADISVNTDGALEIHSGNLMLQGMAAAGTNELEKELEAGFGKKVRAIVSGEEQENTAGDDTPAVKELLDRARRLGIEVVIK
ncbi:MAG: DNA polymerase III subunit gamma/tau [Oscillospiraceae bacterium]